MKNWFSYKYVVYIFVIVGIALLDFQNLKVFKITASFLFYLLAVTSIVVIGSVRFLKLSEKGIGMFLFSILVLITEIFGTSYIDLSLGKYNLLLYGGLTVFQYLFCYQVFSKSVFSELMSKRLYLFLASMGIVITLIESISGLGVKAVPSISVTVYCLFTIFSSLVYLYSLFNTPDLIRLNRNFDFLFALGNLIIYSVVFWVVSFSPIYQKFSFEYLLQFKFMLAHFHTLILIIGYSIFAYAIWIDSKQDTSEKEVRRKWKEHPMITHKL